MSGLQWYPSNLCQSKVKEVIVFFYCLRVEFGPFPLLFLSQKFARTFYTEPHLRIVNFPMDKKESIPLPVITQTFNGYRSESDMRHPLNVGALYYFHLIENFVLIYMSHISIYSFSWTI